jgi:hypothetical protein
MFSFHSLLGIILNIFTGLRDWIRPPGIKWIAAQDAPNCHPSTFYDTVLIDRLVAVMGTGWIEAA